jgi:nucleolar protein 14
MHNKLVSDRIAASLKGSDQDGALPCKLSFEDLDVATKEFTPELAAKIKAALLMLVKNMASMYADLPSFVEYITPLVALAKDETSFVPMLKLIIDSASSRRKPLALQHHKPVALPMLNPDFGQKDDRDTRDSARLKAAYKREFKGAKREIRRDNEFLARHEAQERTQKDAEYKKMINRVYGTIANDAAGLADSKTSKAKKPRTK